MNCPSRALLQITDVLSEVANMVQSEARAMGVWLRVESAGERPLVLADRVQMQQVILNLVMNAVEAMRAVADAWRVLVWARGDTVERQFSLLSATLARVSIRRTERVFSMRSIRPSPTAWAWASRSAGPSWKRTAAPYRPRQTQMGAKPFSSPYRSSIPRSPDDLRMESGRQCG